MFLSSHSLRKQSQGLIQNEGSDSIACLMLLTSDQVQFQSKIQSGKLEYNNECLRIFPSSITVTLTTCWFSDFYFMKAVGTLPRKKDVCSKFLHISVCTSQGFPDSSKLRLRTCVLIVAGPGRDGVIRNVSFAKPMKSIQIVQYKQFFTSIEFIHNGLVIVDRDLRL